MPRSLSAPLALLLGLAAMLALAACGEEDAQLLPGETAREITTNLDAVRQLADEGDCSGAEAAAEQVSAQIEAIGDVDRRLKQALEEGAERLNEVIVECEETSSSEAIAPAIIPEETEEEEPPEEGGKGKQKDKGKGEGEEQPEADSPSLPPQAQGEGKGPENGNGPPAGDEEGEEPEPEEGDDEQSGGVGPGTPAGEGE